MGMSVYSTRSQSIKLLSALELTRVQRGKDSRITAPLAVLDCRQVILSQVVERVGNVVNSGDLEHRRTNVA